LLNFEDFTAYKFAYSAVDGRPEALFKCLKRWSGREDLNLRPPGPEPDFVAY
jgi:hypothetical protein